MKKGEIYYKSVRVNNFWSNNYIEYKSNGDKNRILSVQEFLNKNRPYLNGIINNLKQFDTWKTKLTITISFFSSKDDNDEERVMHSKNDNIKIMISDEADEVMKKLFDSLKNRYQNNLKSMKGSEFVCNLNHGGSYIHSLDWIKSKKATINPINKNDNKCFQYALTVTLNYEEIKKDQQRITKTKPFINKFNWEGINYPSKKDDLRKYQKNNVTFSFSVLYAKKEKIYPAYVPKQNSNRETQVILLMISNAEIQWHYLAVKKLSPLLRGITSKHHGNFYCLNCFLSFATENFNRIKKYVKIKIFATL